MAGKPMFYVPAPDSLNGYDYGLWRIWMSNVLSAQKLLHHILKGSRPNMDSINPTESMIKKHTQWEIADWQAKGIILAHLHPEVRSEFLKHETAHDLWVSLHLRYGDGEAGRVRACLLRLEKRLRDTIGFNADFVANPNESKESQDWRKVNKVKSLFPEMFFWESRGLKLVRHSIRHLLTVIDPADPTSFKDEMSEEEDVIVSLRRSKARRTSQRSASSLPRESKEE